MADRVSEDCAKKLEEIEEQLASRIALLRSRSFNQQLLPRSLNQQSRRRSLNQQSRRKLVIHLHSLTVGELIEARKELDQDCKQLLDEIETGVGALPFRYKAGAPLSGPLLVARLEGLLSGIRKVRSRGHS
jgi:hypothetical protein